MDPSDLIEDCQSIKKRIVDGILQMVNEKEEPVDEQSIQMINYRHCIQCLDHLRRLTRELRKLRTID